MEGHRPTFIYIIIWSPLLETVSNIFISHEGLFAIAAYCHVHVQEYGILPIIFMVHNYTEYAFAWTVMSRDDYFDALQLNKQ